MRYEVIYKKDNANQADHLSRHAVLLETLTEHQQTETAKMNKLLFLLHTTPITNTIDIKKIYQETKSDKSLQSIPTAIKKRKLHSKSVPDEVKKFNNKPVASNANGLILKGGRVALPTSLYYKVIDLAHRGAHPGQSGLIRCLRNHFLFHGMDKKSHRLCQ